MNALVLFLVNVCCAGALIQSFHRQALNGEIKMVGFYKKVAGTLYTPFIEYDLVVGFHPSNSSHTGHIQVLTYEYRQQHLMGGTLRNPCTPDYPKGVKIDDSAHIEFNWGVDLQPGESKRLQEKLRVHRTGLYLTHVVSCLWIDDRVRGTSYLDPNSNYVVTGTITYMNQWGHLSGQTYWWLPYVVVAEILLCLFFGCWMYSLVKHRKHMTLHSIQWQLISLLLLSILEFALSFVEFWSYNQTGTDSNVTIVAVLSVSIIRRTTSRMMILGLVMGYGVCEPFHNINAKCIGLFGICYSIVACCTVIFLTQQDMSSRVGAVIMYYVQLIADIGHTVWTMAALRRTLHRIKTSSRCAHREQKLYMFGSLMKLLVGYAVTAFVWICLCGAIRLTKNYQLKFWHLLWLNEAGWEVLYTSFLCHMAWLWRPSMASWYSYEQLPRVTDGTRLAVMPSQVHQMFPSADGTIPQPPPPRLPPYLTNNTPTNPPTERFHNPLGDPNIPFFTNLGPSPETSPHIDNGATSSNAVHPHHRPQQHEVMTPTTDRSCPTRPLLDTSPTQGSSNDDVADCEEVEVEITSDLDVIEADHSALQQ